MVVLESHGHHRPHSVSGNNSLTHSQYIQPDHGSPTTLDSKKSPLAMLVQTCSLIGADTPLIPTPQNQKAKKPPTPKDNNKEEKGKGRTTPTMKNKGSPPPTKDNYEGNKESEANDGKRASKRPRSASSIASASTISPVTIPTKSPRVDSDSPQKSSSSSTTSTSTSTPPTVTPTIRSGIEVMQQHQGARYPPAMYHPSAMSLYPGGMMDPFLAATMMSNPAYRDMRLSQMNPYANPAAMFGGGRPVQVPHCKDPYCTGCLPQQMQVPSICPAGCVQCDHQKVPYPLHHLYGQGPPTSSANSSSSAQLSQAHPHICNWIVGESYCGKRFASSEELLQHLKSHTTPSTSSHSHYDLSNRDAANASAMALAAAATSLANSSPYANPYLMSMHNAMRGYAQHPGMNIPTSSAYGKLPMPPQGIPGLGGLQGLGMGLPPTHSLAGYFSGGPYPGLFRP